ncbi:MAG TPA: hypothetical protein VES67_26400 [Vicinamibacterales bacterium]|nr:hypothetical protein [Vicinamibacterales bacterium]
MTRNKGLTKSELEMAFSARFRSISTRFPRRVAEAYDGDIKRAMISTDEAVAATVAKWERRQGLVPQDWYAIGLAETDPAYDNERYYVHDNPEISDAEFDPEERPRLVNAPRLRRRVGVSARTGRAARLRDRA